MTEAYKVGVTVAMNNMLMPELKKIGMAFMSLDKQAAGLGLTLGTLGRIAGGAAVVGSIAILAAGVNEARKFQLEATKFAALGFGDAVNAQAIRFASGMDTIGTSAIDNMKLLREATAIVGDVGHAEAILPFLSKMHFGIESVMGEGKGGSFDAMFQSVIKVAELRGALVDRKTGQIDIKRFEEVSNEMVKAYVASGGLVKPQDYLSAMKTGGVSAKLMSDEMFFYGLGHFMQESGGSRTGTSSMSMFQNWAMGKMSQRVAEDMNKVGLLDNKALHYGTTGHIKRVDAMGVIRANEFVDNPFKWVNDVVVPLLKKQGYEGNALNIKLASLLGIRTASNLADQFVREQKIADLYIARAHRASGVDALVKLGDKTMDGQIIELHKQWSNVMRDFGKEVLPDAIAGMRMLVALFKTIHKNSDAIGDAFSNTVPGQALHGARSLTKWLGFGEDSGISDGQKPELPMSAGMQKVMNLVPPSSQSRPIQVKTNISVDGRVLAYAVSGYQSKSLNSPSNSPSVFDSRSGYSPVN